MQVEASGSALVQLQLGVRVHGGWLSQFEVTGWGADMELDSNFPPSLVTEDGRQLVPAIALREGNNLLITFASKDVAPRRGLHRLQLSYRSRLPLRALQGADAVRATFALPRWPIDLEGADVWITAPLGSRFAAAGDAEPDGTITRERFERGAKATLHWHRTQLPRTESLLAELEMPNAAAPAVEPQAQAPTFLSSARSRNALGVALLIAMLVTLKRRSVKLLGLRAAAPAKALVPLPSRLWAAALLGLVVAFVQLHAASSVVALLPLALLVALGLHRRMTPTPAPSIEAPQSAFPQRLALRLLDATTLPGAALLGCAYAFATKWLASGGALNLWVEALLLATPLWFNATRLALPRASYGVAEPQAPEATISDEVLRAPDRAA